MTESTSPWTKPASSGWGSRCLCYELEGWAVIEEVSGGLGQEPPEKWLALAEGGDLIYVAANDAVPYAQIIAIENGRLVRNILKDESTASDDVDVGRLPGNGSVRSRTGPT